MRNSSWFWGLMIGGALVGIIGCGQKHANGTSYTPGSTEKTLPQKSESSTEGSMESSTGSEAKKAPAKAQSNGNGSQPKKEPYSGSGTK